MLLNQLPYPQFEIQREHHHPQMNQFRTEDFELGSPNLQELQPMILKLDRLLS